MKWILVAVGIAWLASQWRLDRARALHERSGGAPLPPVPLHRRPTTWLAGLGGLALVAWPLIRTAELFVIGAVLAAFAAAMWVARAVTRRKADRTR